MFLAFDWKNLGIHLFVLVFVGIPLALLQVWIFNFLRSDARKKLTSRSGYTVLKYGWGMKLVCWLFLLFMISLWFLLANSDGDFTSYIIAAGFGILALSLILEAYFVRIEFDDEFIYTLSPWRHSRTIPWKEVTDHVYSEYNKWHVLKTENSGKIRASDFLVGVMHMLECWNREFERRTPQEVKDIWPKTIDEAVRFLLVVMPEDAKNMLWLLEKDELEQFHQAYDTANRSVLGLWRENRTLIQNCNAEDPADATKVIIEALWERLHSKSSPG